MSHVKEWKNTKRWNPFNSYKLLAHVETWRHIKRGKPIPPPILITVDPSYRCNLNCEWCNASVVRSKDRKKLSKTLLIKLADFLPKWGPTGAHSYDMGVKAVCVAGGGEPLMNEQVGGFIDRLVDNDIEVGVVTNGVLMDKYIDSLSRCTWVGVSVDAGTARVFNKYKGLKEDSDYFHRIVKNIRNLADYSKLHNNKLGHRHPAYGISFKYLIYKENIGDILEATKLAKSIGCKNIHFRPAGTPWDRLNTDDEITFNSDDISHFNEQIREAQKLDDQTFGVYGVTHKFNDQFERCNTFGTCHAIFMTAVIGPSDDDAHEDSFNMGLCCDRRGDSKLQLLKNCLSPEEINAVWGSAEHWHIHDNINIQRECPRCTYQPHNEIYEQVILNDSMTYKFI